MKNKIFKNIALIFCLILFSCKTTEEKKETAESSYLKALESLNDKNYNEAAKAFEKIDDDYPFSKWAAPAQTMAVYAYYKDKSYSDIIRVVEDFIRINPTNEAISYMLYMKALSYYEQIPQISRAQDNTRLAFAGFRELIARFPQSNYANDAEEKLNYINEHLAGAKMSVGRYQITQENYVGALKNFNEVVSRFSHTNQAAEGYYRLVEIYTKLGINNEARMAYLQLSTNYPQNYWYKKAQEIIEK